MKCVFERLISLNKRVMIFENGDCYEIFLNGCFYASCDTMGEALNEIIDLYESEN